MSFRPNRPLISSANSCLNGTGRSKEERITTSMAHQQGLADTTPLREYLTEHLGLGEDGVLHGCCRKH